jgi:4-amino-4-deoxy-L-arabinose transferase-like glycosyltransferase
MITSRQIIFVKEQLKPIQTAIKRFMQSRSLIIVMTVFQLLWLVAIVWTGTNTNQRMILSLGVYSVLVSLVVILLPARYILRFHDLQTWLLHKERRLVLVLCLAALLIGTLYAFNQRVWGDEGRSLRVATIVSSDGLVAGYMESGWLRNKHPPLMPLMNSLILNLFGANLLFLRLASLLFLAASFVVVYFLGRELYDQETGYLGAFFFLSFPLVIRLGSAAMMDIQVTFFFCLALLLVLRLFRTPSYGLSIVIGLLIGLGLLTKYIMVLIHGVLLFCVFFIPDFRKLKPYVFTAIIISFSIFGVWILYANHIGILSEQVHKILNYSGIYQVVRDIGESPLLFAAAPSAVIDEPVNPLKIGIIRLGLESFFTRIPSSLGVHFFPLILLSGLYLFKQRRRSDVFILSWIGVVFITLFLTLPDHRYFLPAFPAIAILIATFVKRFTETRERVFLLSLLLALGNWYLFVDWVREAHLFVIAY